MMIADTTAPDVDPAMRGTLEPGTRASYLWAGHAIVTVQNPATGGRHTFRVRRAEGDRISKPAWFVSYLAGPDNGAAYAYLGMVWSDARTTLRATRATRAKGSPSWRAFEWLASHVEDTRVVVWHEGVCGRCGRRLTVPESIATGLGPVCAGKGGF